MWRNQSQWHFCVVNSTFIFTFIYGFLQALKQDNKKNLLKCTIVFTFQFQSVKCSFSLSSCIVHNDHNSSPVLLLICLPVHCIEKVPCKKNDLVVIILLMDSIIQAWSCEMHACCPQSTWHTNYRATFSLNETMPTCPDS